MDIEKVVFHALTQFLALAQKEAMQNREVSDLRKSAIKECADKVRTLQSRTSSTNVKLKPTVCGQAYPEGGVHSAKRQRM